MKRKTFLPLFKPTQETILHMPNQGVCPRSFLDIQIKLLDNKKVVTIFLKLAIYLLRYLIHVKKEILKGWESNISGFGNFLKIVDTDH